MRCLNEVQLPKELQLRPHVIAVTVDGASMKYSSRRNCNRTPRRPPGGSTSLNEVQLPKELQRDVIPPPAMVIHASMKCSSRRNCNMHDRLGLWPIPLASMKCSSRRNCNPSRPGWS